MYDFVVDVSDSADDGLEEDAEEVEVGGGGGGGLDYFLEEAGDEGYGFKTDEAGVVFHAVLGEVLHDEAWGVGSGSGE